MLIYQLKKQLNLSPADAAAVDDDDDDGNEINDDKNYELVNKKSFLAIENN